MSIIKDQVLGKINAITDNALLADILKMIDQNYDESEVYQLSEDHQKAVPNAIKQIENGEFLTAEESNRQASEWLKK